MRNKNTRSKTYKGKLNKCKAIFYAYSELQYRYGKLLDENKGIVEIIANVNLKGIPIGETFTSDFYCIKKDGEIMVRECIQRDKLLKPQSSKMLDASREYWLAKGVKDWGIVINEEQNSI